MYLIISLSILFVTVLTAIEKQKCRCDVLAPIYNSLQCKIWCRQGSCVTKYNCAQSLYMIEKKQNQCYYNGKFYNISEEFPKRYPNPAGTHLCKYECQVSPIGPYFSITNNCIRSDKSFDRCLFEIINNIDYMYTYSAPIFSKDATLTCPLYWFEYRQINYAGDNCLLKEKCCRYGNLLIKKNKSFKINSLNANCTCSCPPFVTCYV
ncbi:hypothetical protein RN001_013731 [Aquatica leii]|uniref:Uncharacterized protein n=1 Tax=Aquatica leii TaxID=1421715 RepID=A0AAN7P4U3_9COLE|nr:hypothetical protein RN001_013731 [Aquatica leii]